MTKKKKNAEIHSFGGRNMSGAQNGVLI